jgi:hypothetical protein
LAPERGNNGAAPGLDWAIATPLTMAVVAGVVVAGVRSRGGGRRAALLGVATGMAFGLTAAFMKGMTASFSQGGLVGAVSAWQTYAMVAGGLAGMFLMQNAVHAGRLIVAQPGITLADPVVAIVWGVVVFRESVQTGPLLAGALCSAALLAGGAVVLARSPLLEDEGATEEDASRRSGAGAEAHQRATRAS